MATCKDCIHEEVCSALIEKGLPWADGTYPADAFCMAFQNKVVLCKDCKRSRPMIFDGYYYCKRHRVVRKADDFCSKGAKMKGGE
jgi:hypothetical protein